MTNWFQHDARVAAGGRRDDAAPRRAASAASDASIARAGCASRGAPGGAARGAPGGAARGAAAALAAAVISLASGTVAADTGPVGLWKSIDDDTKQPKALIRIAEEGGALVGRIEKILTGKPDAVCAACTDARKDKPVQGMVILQGLRREGEEWNGGEILDPNNGKVYKARVKPVEGGAKLDVRGFIGFAAMGRSQIWLREK